ncbi:MAG: hypothetical protein ACPGPF_00055 [Pontibacterium sp.]
MAILDGDINLMASERLTDNEDGGGRITGTAVVDGASNNLFPDVSDLDRVYGRVNLRKAFVSIATDNTDTYYGGNVIVAKAPSDPKINVTLFSTDSTTDERAAAQSRLESYVVRSSESYYVLLGDQLTGQRVIQCYARTSSPAPEVGDVYVLSTESGGNVSQEQYVRINAVEFSDRVFEDGTGEFTRRVYTLETSDALRGDFIGTESAVRTSAHNSPTLLRTTQVADASRYYGSTTLTEPVAVGDLAINIDSIFSQLVPSATTETSVVNVVAGETKTQTTNNVELDAAAHSLAEEITLANRGYTYVNSLIPLPEVGTVSVDYMAQGRWYRLQDDGAGNLSDGAGGSGTVDYTTGSVILTLGALPDAGTKLIYYWGSAVHYQAHSGAISLEAPSYAYTFDGELERGEVTLSWLQGGQTVTASDDGTGGLTGAAEGSVDYLTGDIVFRPNVLPDAGAVISVTADYAEQGAQTHTQSVAGAGANVSLTLTNTPIAPNTVRISISDSVSIRNDYQGVQTLTAYDNGAGSISATSRSLSISGSVDYNTGQVTLTLGKTGYAYDTDVDNRGNTVKDWYEVAGTFGGSVSVQYRDATTPITPLTKTEQFSAGDIQIDLTPDTDNPIIAGSVDIGWGGLSIYDKNGVAHRTSDDLAIGTINYDTGVLTLQTYSAGSSTVVRNNLLTTYGDWYTNELFFRTPGAPLRPSSLYIRATAVDGELLTATADASGNINGDAVLAGSVDYDTGIVAVEFDRDIFPQSAYFNCVIYSVLPLDADILGLDPVRLPADGRVPIFRDGDVVVLHNTGTTTLTPNAGEQTQLTDVRVSGVEVIDANGIAVATSLYTLNKVTGVITWSSPLDLSPYNMPLTVEHRIEDMVLITDVQINGQIQAVNQISHDYPTGASVSSALIMGDVASRTANVFDQQTWSGVWDDDVIGNPTSAEFNDTTYPITVTNRGAITERWALVFTSATSFRVVGESVGEIAIGDAASPLAPNNPNTGAPYFNLNPLGWGSGWAAGNVLRFNTVGAIHPIWIARTTAQGAAEGESDSFNIQIRGNANA